MIDDVRNLRIRLQAAEDNLATTGDQLSQSRRVMSRADQDAGRYVTGLERLWKLCQSPD
jgi:hypothetical protein